MKRSGTAAVVLIASLVSAQAQLPSFAGKVIGITDGDTITVLHQNEPERVRLYGIDCPEKHQAFGTRARQFTADLAFGREARIVVHDTDRYGRTVGEVILADGTNVNRELVRAGLAWWYEKYAAGNWELRKLETEARSEKQGLWADPNPVAPWDFRKTKPTYRDARGRSERRDRRAAAAGGM